MSHLYRATPKPPSRLINSSPCLTHTYTILLPYLGHHYLKRYQQTQRRHLHRTRCARVDTPTARSTPRNDDEASLPQDLAQAHPEKKRSPLSSYEASLRNTRSGLAFTSAPTTNPDTSVSREPRPAHDAISAARKSREDGERAASAGPGARTIGPGRPRKIEGTGENSRGSTKSRTPLRTTTMTSYERQAFSALFESLLDDSKSDKNKKKPQREGSASDADFTSVGKDRTTAARTDPATRSDDDPAAQDLDALLAEIPSDTSSAPTASSTATTINTDPRSTSTSTYPSSLQDQATLTQTELLRRQRQRTTSDPSHSDPSESPLHPDYDTETTETTDIKTAITTSPPVLKRILQSLDSATSDIAIWQILQKELFSRLDALHAKVQSDTKTLEEANSTKSNDNSTSTSTNKKGKQKRTQRQKKPPRDANVEKQKEQNPSNPTPLPLPTYRTLPLQTLQLLHHRYPHSPLTQTLLPTLKHHSRTSYFLTSTTPLYNTHLSHLITHVHSTPTTSLPKILSLLSEMSNSGLTPNRHTHSTLDTITRYHSLALRGDLGPGVQALEQMPGRSKEIRQVRDWKDWILRGLEDQAMDRARREDVEKEMRAVGAISEFDGDDEIKDGVDSGAVAAAAAAA